MSAEMAQKLVQGGIKAVRSGDHDLARKAFTQALKLDPNNEAAWLGMATITEGTEDKLRILKRVLEINPDNERAQEAIRRLGGVEESVQEEAPAPEPEPVPEPGVTTRFEPEEEAPLDDVIEMPPLQNIQAGDTGQLSDFPKPDWALDKDLPGVDDATAEESVAPVEESVPEIPELVIRSSSEVFSSMPQMPARGQAGIPVPDRAAVEGRITDIEADVQRYLEESLVDYLTPETSWTRKTRGRAGSTEYRTFLLQAGTASFVTLVIVGSVIIFALLNNPTTRRILLPPTIVPTHTPTNTPTATPGDTNTPSPTPQVPSTSTPELPDRAVLGFNDPNFPPTPTSIYNPIVSARSLLDESLLLMQAGEMEAARELIDEALAIESETGAIPPTMRLSEWYLYNGDSTEARRVLTDWQEAHQDDSSLFDRSQAYLYIGLARVDIYEAANRIGDRFSLLDRAQDYLEASLGLATGDNVIGSPNRVNTEGYLLLADAYVLRGNVDSALEILDNALEVPVFDNRSLLEDTQIRRKKAEILIDARRYAEAFQELYFLLLFDPFNEEALILQAELALETNQPGLGVLYAQQYLLYYPGSLRGFYLLGQAREAENKFDLALNAYSRAVAGNREIEEYTSDPFFLTNLLARADLLVRQGRADEAAQDFSDALEFAGDDPELRIRRLQASYSTGEYEAVLADVEELLGVSGVNQSEVLYYEGLTLIALADDGDSAGDYGRAAEALDDALSRGLASGLRANAFENLAWANLQERSFDDALSAINDAIDFNATAYRRYLRGLILEAQGSLDEALLDFEFIVTWGQFYNFPFYELARDAYDSTLSRSGAR